MHLHPSRRSSKLTALRKGSSEASVRRCLKATRPSGGTVNCSSRAD